MRGLTKMRNNKKKKKKKKKNHSFCQIRIQTTHLSAFLSILNALALEIFAVTLITPTNKFWFQQLCFKQHMIKDGYPTQCLAS